LGPREKLQGRAGFCQEIFFLKSESGFESDFSGIGFPIFFSGDREVKTAQTPTPENPASTLFSNFGKKICKAMAGLDRHANFYAIAKTKPVVTAVVCFLSTLNMGSLSMNRRPKKISFF
jgi:hypothetical protein